MPGSPPLEFFYDCSSPWTYFAFTRIIPMARELDVAIRWRPHLVGGVFNAVNQEVYAARQAMFDGENSRRLDYYIKDLADWARLCGVQANMPPGHPISSVKAMRGAFFAEEQGKIVPYNKAVFETYWSGENPDISSDEVLLGIVDAVGIEADGFFRAINDQHYKDLLRANTEELISRGGYGSPTIYIDTDDMFFGNDRLPLVEAALRRHLDA